MEFRGANVGSIARVPKCTGARPSRPSDWIEIYWCKTPSLLLAGEASQHNLETHGGRPSTHKDYDDIFSRLCISDVAVGKMVSESESPDDMMPWMKNGCEGARDFTTYGATNDRAISD